MSEPEVALVFTPEPWVEDLHRHLSDHGGARVRSLVVEPAAARDEQYDVLVVGHRWVALTQGLVDQVHARSRSIVGVFDRDEPAGRIHLAQLGVDAVIESDASASAFVTVIVSVAGRRDDASARTVDVPRRRAQLVVVGGLPGAGRTEIAIQLALGSGRISSAVLVDADDVAPAVAQRLGLTIEPNLRTAIEAVEHRRTDVAASIAVETATGLRVLAGIPNAASWSEVRPGEVLRVLEELGEHVDTLVVDGAGALEDLGGTTRGRYATARALVHEADIVLAVCDGSPVGVARLLSWIAQAAQLAAGVTFVAVVNRAPSSRFQRGEIFEELVSSTPVADVVFVPNDPRVATAAWNGVRVRRGPFTRSVEPLAALVKSIPPASVPDHLATAS